jgi:hypothetical protein
MKRIWVVLALAGCDAGKPKPAVTSGSGSAAPPASTCVYDGTYRLRFHSNGVDGWWLYLTAKAEHFAITGGQTKMLGLAVGPIAVTTKACTVTIAQHTQQAGDLKLAFTVDPSGTVTGNLTRTDDYGLKNEPNTPVLGVRETAPTVTPACVKPGVYKLAADPKTKWKLSQGHPSPPLSCNDPMDLSTEAYLRISVLGHELYIDEVDSEVPYEQGFSRGKVQRDGDCAVTVDYEKQDFRFSGLKLVLDGDKLAGVADAATWDFFEDGEAGENLWKCSAKRVKFAGTRVAD